MSKPTYTDEDVQKLVETVEGVVQTLSEDVSIEPTRAEHHALEHVLKPFQPDPEDALIEAMAQAFANAAWPEFHPSKRRDRGVGLTAFPEDVDKGIRAALAAYLAHKGGTT